MSSNITHKAAKPMVWIKDREGDTWICPKESVSEVGNISDDKLSKECLNESENPQNN